MLHLNMRGPGGVTRASAAVAVLVVAATAAACGSAELGGPTTSPRATARSTTERRTLDRAEADAAQRLVLSFVRAMRENDLDAAAELWSGYPDAGTDTKAGRIDHLRRFRERADWLTEERAVPTVFVTAAFAF